MSPDFDDETPTLVIPRETMHESRANAAPAHIDWSEETQVDLEVADLDDHDVSDGVPLSIEQDASTEPRFARKIVA